MQSFSITRNAILSIEIARIRNEPLVINIPRSTKEDVENLQFIIDVIMHRINILKGEVS